jgi:hypothetical protein
MRRLLRAVRVLAIFAVIAFMAWTKARGITFVIPYSNALDRGLLGVRFTPSVQLRRKSP